MNLCIKHLYLYVYKFTTMQLQKIWPVIKSDIINNNPYNCVGISTFFDVFEQNFYSLYSHLIGNKQLGVLKCFANQRILKIASNCTIPTFFPDKLSVFHLIIKTSALNQFPKYKCGVNTLHTYLDIHSLELVWYVKY